jgi:hypothetical protein
MRTVTRIAAVMSFLFCFLAGVCMLIPAFSGPGKDGIIAAALGFFLIGLAFFFGALLWVAGQKCSAGGDSKHPAT